MPGCLMFDSEVSEHKLYDHRPYLLNQDDYQRVCHIPKKKGANFRDLPGVRVRADNKVEFDPDVERVKLPSGKPLVPDYAMTFVRGTSSNSVGYSLLLKKEKAIIVQPDRVTIANGHAFGCVSMKDFFIALVKRLKCNMTAYENYRRIYVPDGDRHNRCKY
ncbi:unnamed protein product [Fraxinus pennsylvanica]|uniref:Uncharacterized protein n=1 Tax=Fraxinus pennsylvanica TaxID=56036 RepID=A0AAD2E4B2_9LAMI|nr:unnamed protein product [Fraxinus pennsylvanica]